MSSAKIKYILAVVLYGTIGLILHYIKAPSEFVVLCRGIIGTATILLISKFSGRKVNITSIKNNLPTLICSGACLGFNWIFLFAAYRVTTVAIASLCNYTAPIIVLVITDIMYRKKPELKKIICILAAAVGIVFVSGIIDESGSSFNAKGIALGFSAAMGFVGLVLCNRRLKNIDAIDKAIVQLLVSAIVVLPYVIIMNRGTVLSFDAVSVLLIITLGVVHTGVAYIFYFGGLSEISVESVAILGYLEPVISIVTSALILREQITALCIIGAFLILGAALYNELGQAKSYAKLRS